MPPLNMNMQQSATYTVRAFRYSTTLTRIFFDYVCIPVWASCLCPAIIRGFRVHNYSNVFQNFQFSLSKCCVSLYVRRSFYPATTILCSVRSSSVACSLRKQTVLPENICRGNYKNRSQKLFCCVQWIRNIECPSINWREGLHTVTILHSISETVVELSFILFALIYNALFLCVCVCVCVLCACACVFVRHCFLNKFLHNFLWNSARNIGIITHKFWKF
jgi:hypothetical protein